MPVPLPSALLSYGSIEFLNICVNSLSELCLYVSRLLNAVSVIKRMSGSSSSNSLLKFWYFTIVFSFALQILFWEGNPYAFRAIIFSLLDLDSVSRYDFFLEIYDLLDLIKLSLYILDSDSAVHRIWVY